eukprot:1016337-Amorphochlora_amoeboformis.AAC.1
MDNARTRTEITPDEGSRRPNPSVTKESQGSRDFIPDYPPSFVHLTSTALKKTKVERFYFVSFRCFRAGTEVLGRWDVVWEVKECSKYV